jgi:endothelin-converting enzyme/putative endopeptidase
MAEFENQRKETVSEMIPTAHDAFHCPPAEFDSGTILGSLRFAKALAAAVFFAVCCLALPRLAAQAAAPAATPAATHGIAIADMDRSVKPGDDFYRYANGAWIDRTEVPPDRTSVNVFSTLDDLSRKRTAEIIEDAAKANAPAGSDKRKMADVYNAFLDEAGIEAKGLGPVKEQLASIAAIQNRRQLSTALGKTLRADVDLLNNSTYHTANLFGLWVAPGFHDSEHYAPYLLQGGLEMPDRDYYLVDSEHMKEVRAKYAVHVAAMLRLAGFSDAEARAVRVIALEHSIAEAQVSIAEIEIIEKADNLWKRYDFAAKAPGLDWGAYFEGAGLAGQQEFMVWTPTALTGEAALVASAPLETWKDWLAYHLVEDYASFLPRALAEERFGFFQKTLGGVEQQRPRAERAVMLVDALLGDAVGKVYAQKYFSPQAKAQAEAMVAHLIAVYHKRLAALPWLADSTRAEAQAKLDSLIVNIGYPEKWEDYSAYEVRAGDAFGNAWRYGLWYLHHEVARIGKPVDRHEWCMEPQTVNAVNMPLHNSLSFPAAILQPPFFDPEAPAAVNYGAIGTVIGHEISHTFDEEGSAFDSKGRLRNWWTQADKDHFNQASAKLAKQFDAYEPFPGVHVNGEQTIDEDIADLGGVASAYDAYRLNGNDAPVQDGFSPDQQFFIAFEQNYGAKTREASLRNQVLTDSHAPAEYRALTVRNFDAWYKAFNVQPGEKLYLVPDDRVKIW